jgi:hypothetical protein
MRVTTKRVLVPILMAALLGTLAAGCGDDGGGDKAPTARNRAVSPSTLNGTYHHRLTKAGAVAAGVPDDPDIGKVQIETLRDGKWLGGPTAGRATGTYEVVGDRIVFSSTEEAITNTFTFERNANGDLELDPVLPMDRGDQFNFASAPWRRVGPPVRLMR